MFVYTVNMPKPKEFQIKIRSIKEEQEAFALLQENFTDERWSRIIDHHDKRRLAYFKAIREKNELFTTGVTVNWQEVDIVEMVNDFGSFKAVAEYIGVASRKIRSQYRRAIGDNGPLNRF